MAQTATHVMTLVNRLLVAGFLLTLMFATFSVSCASTEHQTAAADKDREIADTVRIMRARLDALTDENSKTRATIMKTLDVLGELR